MYRTLLVLALGTACRPAECRVHDDCDDAAFCSDRDCVDVVGTRLDFGIAEARVGQDHPDGAPWDDDGSAPELVTVFGFEDVETCETTPVPEGRRAIFDEGCTFLMPDAPFVIALYDEDPEGFELAADWVWSAPEDVAALVRENGALLEVTDNSQTVALDFWVVPLIGY